MLISFTLFWVRNGNRVVLIKLYCYCMRLNIAKSLFNNHEI